MEDELVRAILIASDPSQGALHHQALEYLSNIQQNAAETWPLALTLFMDLAPNGVRKHPPQARFFGLRVLDEFFDNRFESLDPETFRTLQQSFMSYIQSEFVYGSAEAGATFLRNKFSHTLTLFFLCTYVDQWTTFFTDLFTLMHPADSPSSATFNRHLSLLFFHLVLEISGEVADQVIKSARQFNPVRHERDGRVRDAVRQRDAAQINRAVLAIVERGSERMAALRGNSDPSDYPPEVDEVIEVVDCGIRTFASYVGWIDINLSVTPTTVPLLFNMLSDPSLPIRLATSAALLRIVAKGLKEPADKLQLLKVLSLGQVIISLEKKTRIQQAERGSDVDEGEESFREALGKLLNVVGLELTKLADDCPDEGIRAEAETLLEEILPVLLRFMSDEYDDTSSTIFPMLQTVLNSYKRFRKLSLVPLNESKMSFLASLVEVILEKMKWDEEADPDDVDEDDKVAFEGLRKELRTFLDSVSIIDQNLVTEALQSRSLNTLNAFRNGASVKWHEAELAVYLVYIFGEINKSGGKGRAAFCLAPATDKDKRKFIDYSEYSLTAHGEMLLALVQSGISSYPHRTVVMQFFETAARYGDFFKVRKECIVPTLQGMLGAGGLHDHASAMRSRVFYLFHRFIKETKHDIPVNLIINLLDGFRGILDVRVEMPETEETDQQLILAEAVNNPGLFDAQLYLFETVGTLVSVLHKSIDQQQQASVLLSVVRPLLDALSTSLLSATKNPLEILPILEIHHIILALGNIAKGFPDFPSPVTDGYVPPPLEVFGQIAQAILVCLEATNVFKIVRDATRFAFARIIATSGPNVTHFIPQLMTDLLVHFEPSELVDFMSFIGLLMHKLQNDMFDTLDQLIGPLSTHIITLLSRPVEGSGDETTIADTKKGYVGLLNNVMVSKLHGILISERNKGGFETLLGAMLTIAEDISDPISQKAALVFLGRCVQAWGQFFPMSPIPDQNVPLGMQETLPGFEQFIYQRLVPSAFRVPSLPAFNIKDGQMISVLHEIANLLQTICRSRGTEAYDYFLTIFLPSQNWPQDTALDFMGKLRVMDNKNFRRYFTDFVRSSR